MRLRTEILATLCAVVALGAAPPAKPAPIDFLDSIDAARAVTAAAPKPIVLQFGASWCGWCRKLESETLTDPTILARASKFAWVHVDIDAQPALAARYGARAVPHAVIIDSAGKSLAQLRGFGDVKTYAAFLTRGEASFVPTPTAPLDPAHLPEHVRSLVTSMAPAGATGRQQCVGALRAVGAPVLPVLVEMLGDDRLAIRAAAGFALGELTDASIGFDALAAAAERQAQIERWNTWITSDKARLAEPALSPEPPKREEKAEPAPRPKLDLPTRSKSIASAR
ncbi:MAG: thioredoxin family protein [Phycisphaerae bacterium]|nr:thioredoxin family protein [Phycisphaerae bacterium]